MRIVLQLLTWLRQHIKQLLLGGLLTGVMGVLGVLFWLQPWNWKSFDLPGPEAPFTKTVELRKVGKKFQLYRHGEPYYIRGCGGFEQLELFKQCGGNTLRTWTTLQLDSVLNEAQAHGLTVIAGLNVIPIRWGMDYGDPAAVSRQLERMRQTVLRFKDHPALLMWAIGNELDLGFDDENIWKAVNQIAAMIHKVDPNHPTTTMIMPNSRRTRLISTHAPEIDLISFNVFGGLEKIADDVTQFWWGWEGPYLISEWGPLGWWEVRTTSWFAPLDGNSKTKWQKIEELYDQSMGKDSLRCLGSCIFYWGHKQERTHTWFSMFSETGEKTPTVDLIHYKWKGTWPENRAPWVDSLRFDLPPTGPDLYLKPGQEYRTTFSPVDPDQDSLQISAEISPEGSYKWVIGGDEEYKPQPVEGLDIRIREGELYFKAPKEPGPYRLYLYARDGKGGLGLADRPFYVTEQHIQ